MEHLHALAGHLRPDDLAELYNDKQEFFRKSSMNEKEWLPAGAQLVTTYLVISKAEEAIDFYEQAFGFVIGEKMAGPGGKVMHASMLFHGQHVVMFGIPEGETQAPPTDIKVPASMYLYNEDVDALVAQATAAGATLVEAAQDMFWGDRIARVRDPFGFEWTLATKVGEFDASKMPKFD